MLRRSNICCAKLCFRYVRSDVGCRFSSTPLARRALLNMQVLDDSSRRGRCRQCRTKLGCGMPDGLLVYTLLTQYCIASLLCQTRKAARRATRDTVAKCTVTLYHESCQIECNCSARPIYVSLQHTIALIICGSDDGHLKFSLDKGDNIFALNFHTRRIGKTLDMDENR